MLQTVENIMLITWKLITPDVPEGVDGCLRVPAFNDIRLV